MKGAAAMLEATRAHRRIDSRVRRGKGLRRIRKIDVLYDLVGRRIYSSQRPVAIEFGPCPTWTTVPAT
jgi:hypothetical protein